MFDSIINTFAGVAASIRLLDLVDIAIVAFAVYKIINFISGTRAMQLVKGLMILVAAMIIARIMNLYTVHFLLSNGLRYGAIAIIVIFYPELRRILEYIGKSGFSISRLGREKDNESVKKMISEILDAVTYFSDTKTGALIVFEKNIRLDEILTHGTIMNADTTSMLLKSIFYEGTSLHDGAVVMRDFRIYAAGCILPVSQNKDLEKTLGTRHRAGLGITEVSDAIALIVSEESGIISAAYEGKLSRFLDVKSVEKILLDAYISDVGKSRQTSVFSGVFGRSD